MTDPFFATSTPDRSVGRGWTKFRPKLFHSERLKRHHHHMSSIYSNRQLWDYHPDVGLIVASGYYPRTKKVELSTDLQTKTSLPDIPYGCNFLADACFVIVNKTTVFLGGGKGDQGCSPYYGIHNETYFLNLETKQWTRGPDLDVRRYQLSCSLVTKPFPQIVMVGGILDGSSTFSKHTSILNLESNTITKGINNHKEV